MWTRRATPKLRETVYLSVMKFLRECSQATVFPRESFASANTAMIKIRWEIHSGQIYVYIKKRKFRIRSPSNFYLAVFIEVDTPTETFNLAIILMQAISPNLWTDASQDDIKINHYSGNEYERTTKLFLKSLLSNRPRTESITLNQIKVLLHFHPRPSFPILLRSIPPYSFRQPASSNLTKGPCNPLAK